MSSPFVRADFDESGDLTLMAAKRLGYSYAHTKEASYATSTLSTATISAAGTLHHGSSTLGVPSTVAVGGTITGDSFDAYGFDMVAGQTYMFSLRGTGPAALGDTFLYVTDDGFNILDGDDDGGDGVNSLITYTATYTGLHAIAVGAYPGSGLTGTYTLDAISYSGADTVGDTFAAAPSLTVGGTTFGFIDAGVTPVYAGLGDVDTFKLTVEAGKFYTIELSGGADYASDYTDLPAGELDPVLFMYDADGNLLTVSDDIDFTGGDINSKISFIAQESGTYYFDATSYEPWTGGYTIVTTATSLADISPLDSIDWVSANDVPFVDVAGTPTAYVYFGDSDQNFGQTADDGVSPMVTFDWNDYEKAQVMDALDEYEKILGTDYVVTTDESIATFRLLKAESEQYGAYFSPQDPSFGADQGVGVFNILSGGWSFDQQQSLEQGGYSFGVILHEFGHAHGLAHPHDTGGGSTIMLGVTSSTGSYGLYDLNQGVYTVMSYNDAWDFHPEGPSPYNGANVDNGWSGSLSAFDIAQLQIRYGVHDYATGDNVYTITDVVNDSFYQTIWDTGGADGIVYSGTLNATIDLLAATLDYSPTGGGVISYVDGGTGTPLRGGYTIANGVVIENATGGAGADVLRGNEAANMLTGNAGNDTVFGFGGDDRIDGGAGKDVAVYSGNLSEYVILREHDGSFKVIDKVADRDGEDVLTGIESWTFADGTYTALQLGATNLLRGTAGNDDLRANQGQPGNYGNYMAAGAGDDILRGSRNDDMFIGGAGNDQMHGAGGADQFRFYGTQIDGGSDLDRIYDLNFGQGDTLVFGSYGAASFFDSAHVNAFSDGTSAIIGSFAGLYEADLASSRISVARQSAYNDNLLVQVDNGAGQIQGILISNSWSQYVAAMP